MVQRNLLLISLAPLLITLVCCHFISDIHETWGSLMSGLGLSLEQSVLSTATWQTACDLLATIQPDETLYPGTARYERARSTYWDRSQRLATPSCIFQPSSSAHISSALIIINHTKAPFAIKSGGHGQWHGSSSIDRGIVIDLKRMAHLELGKNNESLSIGPGNRWVDVYTAMEPLSLTVVGGRSADVGVGGFLQGGGISFHSNMYGWGLDNIREFQVVLGNGTITTASQSRNPSLYRALRGGGANFAIVTSFTVDTYPFHGGWGGVRGFPLDQEDAVIEALLDYGQSVEQDPKASLIAALTLLEGQWIWGADTFYCGSVTERPSIYNKLYEIPAFFNDDGPKSLSQKAMEMAQGYPANQFNTMWVFCTKVDAQLIKLYSSALQREGGKLLDVADFRITAVVQFITSATTSFFNRRGGNGLGLPAGEPFLMFNIEPHWTDPADSPRIYRALKAIADEVEAEATRLGMTVDYTYSNYASPFQDAFERKSEHGVKAAEFLAQVAQEYDPKMVFQQLRGAGFKLRGPPVSESP